MLKKNKGTLIVSSLILLLPVVFGLLLWNRLPEQIATHFGPDGTPNGWSNKAFAVFGLPLFLFITHWFCVLITFIDPKKKNIAGKPFRLMLWICPIISLLTNGLVYATALGIAASVHVVIPLVLGLLFMIIGNYLPKCKPNYTIGIKVPWALNDEDNWNHTHRLVGWVWVIGGVLIIATAFFQQAWILLLMITLVIVLISTVYSYLYYRKYGEKQ